MNVTKLFLNYKRNNAFTQIKYITCWSCGKNVTNLLQNLFCSNCNALQRPNVKDNHFKVMGIKETYDINEQELTKKFKDLQKYLHPDKFSYKNTQEQEISAQFSSLVNNAYKTLLEPLSRGIYMLSLNGKILPENTEVDQQFLMQIMEKNEEVENANSEEEILKLNDENKAVLQDLQNKVSKEFFDGNLNNVINLLSKMKYYTSIDSQIQNIIRNRGITR